MDCDQLEKPRFFNRYVPSNQPSHVDIMLILTQKVFWPVLSPHHRRTVRFCIRSLPRHPHSIGRIVLLWMVCFRLICQQVLQLVLGSTSSLAELHWWGTRK
jgi:hypothetical protein